MSSKLNEGRVAIVTGAGQGLGRAHAHAFAADGASVVVNDYDADSANTVAGEIRDAGGRAVASVGDVADWAYGESLIATAVDEFGRLDTLVNNAGFVRDRMLVSLSEQPSPSTSCKICTVPSKEVIKSRPASSKVRLVGR